MTQKYIQRRLLSETELDFDKALKTAQAMEVADRETRSGAAATSVGRQMDIFIRDSWDSIHKADVGNYKPRGGAAITIVATGAVADIWLRAAETRSQTVSTAAKRPHLQSLPWKAPSSNSQRSCSTSKHKPHRRRGYERR